MTALRIRGLSGQPTEVNDSDVEQLAAALRGQLLRPDDADYDAARSVWNGMIDRRPALIARCRGPADVMHAVEFANGHRLLLSVRGGGHNAAGYAVADQGLMIDLSPMRGIRVDPARRVARVEGGARWADVDHETQVFGLATPGGVVSDTGVAGLTLGGGFGWLRRKYGLSCDNLLSVDVVTADGQLRTASETENADLFWALRGGGGNFGVVTSFEFQLHPVGPNVAAAAVFYPFDAARQVLRGWRDFMARAPDELSSNAALWTVPPTDDWPEELHGAPMVAVIALYAGPIDEGESVIQPLRELAKPLADLGHTFPYVAFQSMLDPFFPEGELQYYWKSIDLDRLDDDAIELLIEHAEQRPSPMNLLDIWALGGRVARVPAKATAFGDRSAPFTLVLNTSWSDPAESGKNIEWTRTLWRAMHRFSSGSTYLNFPGLEGDGDSLVRQAFGDNYARLARIKGEHDPGNLFRMNQNIEPGAEPS